MTQPPAGPPPPGQPPIDGPQTGPPRPRKRRTGIIVVSVLAVLIVVAAISAVLVLTLQGKTPLASDEQRVETALREFYDTLSNDGFEAATQLACTADRDEFAAMPDTERTAVEELEFRVDIESVDEVVVDGDHAQARISGAFSFSLPDDAEEQTEDDTSQESLVQEDGEWRVCSSTDIGAP